MIPDEICGARTEAKRTYYDVVNDIEEITVGDHERGFGGPGDGYCYAHQSFDCLDALTPEERAALQEV